MVSRVYKCLGILLMFAVISGFLYAQETEEGQPFGYTVKPKDILTIKFYRHLDLNQESAEVTPDGTLLMPLIGPVKVAGLTITEIERKLIDLYSQDYLKNPYITVAVLSRRYYVLGEVKLPGAYPMQGTVTVLTAITQAGGFTDYAAENKVAVIRTIGNQKQTIKVNVERIIKTGDTGEDVILQPGDVVNVPQSAF
ncbi:polysaccharide biosynthesis/export family protein [bacterium]|nr:polysaccharide biosynthesis/export family protein [bacterium]MCP5462659.1 polysaccharide biosynthesis/export family protein [bacterium]